MNAVDATWRPTPQWLLSAMVLASDSVATKAAKTPAWIHGMAMRSEPTMFAGRDLVNPQAGRDCAAELYKKAGITNPRKELDAAEIYVPFSWFEPMWMENLGLVPRGEAGNYVQGGTNIRFDGRHRAADHAQRHEREKRSQQRRPFTLRHARLPISLYELQRPIRPL